MKCKKYHLTLIIWAASILPPGSMCLYIFKFVSGLLWKIRQKDTPNELKFTFFLKTLHIKSKTSFTLIMCKLLSFFSQPCQGLQYSRNHHLPTFFAIRATCLSYLLWKKITFPQLVRLGGMAFKLINCKLYFYRSTTREQLFKWGIR